MQTKDSPQRKELIRSVARVCLRARFFSLSCITFSKATFSSTSPLPDSDDGTGSRLICRMTSSMNLSYFGTVIMTGSTTQIQMGMHNAIISSGKLGKIPDGNAKMLISSGKLGEIPDG